MNPHHAAHPSQAMTFDALLSTARVLITDDASLTDVRHAYALTCLSKSFNSHLTSDRLVEAIKVANESYGANLLAALWQHLGEPDSIVGTLRHDAEKPRDAASQHQAAGVIARLTEWYNSPLQQFGGDNYRSLWNCTPTPNANWMGALAHLCFYECYRTQIVWPHLLIALVDALGAFRQHPISKRADESRYVGMSLLSHIMQHPTFGNQGYDIRYSVNEAVMPDFNWSNFGNLKSPNPGEYYRYNQDVDAEQECTPCIYEAWDSAVVTSKSPSPRGYGACRECMSGRWQIDFISRQTQLRYSDALVYPPDMANPAHMLQARPMPEPLD